MESHLRRLALCGALAACNTTPVRSSFPSARATNLSASDVSEGGAKEVKRTLVAHEEIPDMPGWESRMYLVEYPPGVQASPHAHTEQCVGYVLEGRFESAFGNGPTGVTHTGEGFVDLPHEPHRFRNPDPTRPLRFVVAGTFRKDEPLFRPLPGAAGFTSPSEQSSPPDAIASGVQVAGSSERPVTETKRTLLVQREIADLPGMESRIYLVEFPPAAESKLHMHTVQGIGYVLEGSFESAFGDGPVTVKRAGQGFVDIPGKPHHFRNADSARQLRFVIAGTFHKDEPLFKVLAQ